MVTLPSSTEWLLSLMGFPTPTADDESYFEHADTNENDGNSSSIMDDVILYPPHQSDHDDRHIRHEQRHLATLISGGNQNETFSTTSIPPEGHDSQMAMSSYQPVSSSSMLTTCVVLKHHPLIIFHLHSDRPAVSTTNRSS
jgi:hypothetical protein